MDTAEYFDLVAKHLSGVIRNAFADLRTEGALGGGLPAQALRMVCDALLKDHYEMINDVLGEVQTLLDETNGIHIRPQTDGKYCSWCTSIAGRYEYGKEPQSVYRRHDNCGCTITYENGRQRQDVWSKRTWEVPEIAPQRAEPVRLTGAQGREIEQRNLSQITRFSRTQGEAVQGQNLRYRGLTSGGGSGIIKTERQMANGLRRSPSIRLSEEDKRHLLSEIEAIGADPSKFKFRDGYGSGYSDERDIVFVSSNIFPSNDGSKHPRDLMSERAALAHEYYGHRAYRGTKVPKGAWNDEFRASYMAAKNCPNLTDEDRYYLVLDAIERAKEAGITIKYNDFMRSVLYG